MDAVPHPRRRNASDTKARILEAAKHAFTELGYEQAGLRDIAAIANVNSALLVRYFGSKAGLFEAALIDAIGLGPLLDHGQAEFGRRLLAHLMDTDRNVKPPSMMAISASDAVARDIVTRVMQAHAIAPLAAWLGPPDARERALQIVMLSSAFALYVRQAPAMAEAAKIERSMMDWYVASVQAVVDRR